MSQIEKLYLSKRNVFTIKLLSYYWGESDIKKIHHLAKYYCKVKKLFRLRRGLYSLILKPSKNSVAMALGAPCYISLNSALTYHGINFQYSDDIHLISNKSKKINVGFDIILHKIPDKISLNEDGLLKVEDFVIASKERAVCDMLYLYPNFYFDNLSGINTDELEKISLIYNNNRLKEEIKKLIIYVKSQ